MKPNIFFYILPVLLIACSDKQPPTSDSIIAQGQMPNITVDASGYIHVVYGTDDSLMYTSSKNRGKTFDPVALVAVVPGLAASHTRGPQIAATESGLVIMACNETGDIFSFVKERQNPWTRTSRINDVDTIAKENFTALAADDNNVIAVWLDLREKHNQVFGARSADGGKSWSKNFRIYASPDSTVCECCKPAVAMKKSHVSVLFRNWLHGNRDLYLIQSKDGGVTFGPATKLGFGSWALNGCPMDGGSVVLDKNGNPKTVWNRKGVIYASEPGKQELELGKGKNAALETIHGQNLYAWTENNNVVVKLPAGKQDLGPGQLPLLKAIDEDNIVCIWENKKQIHSKVISP